MCTVRKLIFKILQVECGCGQTRCEDRRLGRPELPHAPGQRTTRQRAVNGNDSGAVTLTTGQRQRQGSYTYLSKNSSSRNFDAERDKSSQVPLTGLEIEFGHPSADVFFRRW